jgi:hypothetical protein
MTLAPTYEAIKRETSEKPSIKEKPTELLGTGQQCKDGLLPSIKRNVCENVEMFYQDCEVVPQVLYPCSKHLFCYGICDSLICLFCR